MIIVGAAIRAHGLKGAVRVRLFTDSPQIFEPRRKVFIRPKSGAGPGSRTKGRGRSQSQGRACGWIEVEWVRPHPKGLLLKLEGVDTPEQAGLLAGAEIGLPRCDLPDLEEGEFFWSDLLGLAVTTGSGREIGRVENIFETGANDVLVVKGPYGEVLVPAVEAAVRSVDLEAGELVLTDLAGLVPEGPEKAKEAGDGAD